MIIITERLKKGTIQNEVNKQKAHLLIHLNYVTVRTYKRDMNIKVKS